MPVGRTPALRADAMSGVGRLPLEYSCEQVAGRQPRFGCQSARSRIKPDCGAGCDRSKPAATVCPPAAMLAAMRPVLGPNAGPIGSHWAPFHVKLAAVVVGAPPVQPTATTRPAGVP